MSVQIALLQSLESRRQVAEYLRWVLSFEEGGKISKGASQRCRYLWGAGGAGGDRASGVTSDGQKHHHDEQDGRGDQRYPG